VSTTNIYRVLYHFEWGGKKASQDYQDYVSAAANDYESIKAVLANNSRVQGGSKLVIDAVTATPSGASNILT
jgi:hypothetical protein